MEQQERLREKLKTLPTNLILVGPKYSGKKTLVNEIAPDFIWVEGKVDNIRDLGGGDYVFADVDNWHPSCFSAMLKLLEENEHHIIITCKNIMNLPNSIQSRCIIEHMDPYTNIKKYCNSIGEYQFYSDEMLHDIDKFIYKEDYDLDVYFSVLCNRLIDRIKNGEPLEKELIVCSTYNSMKTLKALNTKQFIVNWEIDLNKIK